MMKTVKLITKMTKKMGMISGLARCKATMMSKMRTKRAMKETKKPTISSSR